PQLTNFLSRWNLSTPLEDFLLAESLGAAISQDKFFANELQEASDHFDSETFLRASNNVFSAKNAILKDLGGHSPDFIAARRELGGALHTLQDFYAHSNYVDLGYTNPDERIGKSLNSFAQGTPRIAAQDEPVCAWHSSVLMPDDIGE